MFVGKEKCWGGSEWENCYLIKWLQVDSARKREEMPGLSCHIHR